MPAEAGIQAVEDNCNFKNLDSRLRGKDNVSSNFDTAFRKEGLHEGCLMNQNFKNRTFPGQRLPHNKTGVELWPNASEMDRMYLRITLFYGI